MAFVPATPLASSAFAGCRIVNRCSTTAPNTVVAALGRGTGNANTSLDKLGLAKPSAESFVVRDGNRPAGFSADYEELITGAYRHVFGNAYLMESERGELAAIESQFRDGRLTMKEFCRALGKTHQYRKRFFEGRPLYGAIELNFKHFLGRAPDGLEQYRAKSAIYDAQGYEKFVDSFFDCGEFDEFFGENCSPFYRGHLSSSRVSMSSFTHQAQLYRGASGSDKANPRTGTNLITLNRAGIQSKPLAIINPGGAAFVAPDASSGSWQNGFSGATMAHTCMGATRGDRNMYRIEVAGFSQGGANGGSPGIVLRSRQGKFYKNRNNGPSKISDYRNSNQVFLVTFDKLNETYQRIHKQGGKIASIMPV